MILKTPNRKSIFLLLSLIIGMSIMYTGYFYDFSDSSPNQSPGWLRACLKLISIALFYAALNAHFSVAGFLKNFGLKLPFIFIGLVTLLLAPTYIDGETQAINMLFFLPLLAFNWNRNSGNIIFRQIFNTITVICIAQIILDPVLKLWTGLGFQNLSLIGGVGNANNFGYWLLSAAIYSRVVMRNSFLFYFFIICSIFTGSAMIILLVAAILISSLFMTLKKLRVSHLVRFGILIIAGPAIIATVSPELLYAERIFMGVGHAVNKLTALLIVLSSSGGDINSLSVSGRLDYFREGMLLIADYPLSLIVGHPNGRPIFTGDGWWIALVVTHGVIVTLIFAICNLLIVLRGIRIRSPETIVCSLIIIITCIIFAANRILAYWPAGFLYFISISYICNKSAPGPHVSKNLL